MKDRNRLKLFSLSLLFTVLYSKAVWADDTEIYLGNQDNLIRPNILFVLDTSDSMRLKVNGTNDSRLATMRTAINDILSSVDNVNVGLMRLNGRKRGDIGTPTGGPVIFPVTNIDAPLSEVPSETSTLRSVTVPIRESADDVTQSWDGDTHSDISLSKTVLEPNIPSATEKSISIQINASADDAIERPSQGFKNHIDSNFLKVEDQGSSKGHQRFGVRFDNIDIPPDAEILNAKITFTAAKTNYGAMSVLIKGEDLSSPSGSGPFTPSNQDLKKRFDNATTETVQWSPENWLIESRYETPNLADLVSYLTSSAVGWSPNDPMVFLFEDEEQDTAQGRKRLAYSSDGDSTKAPTLSITYRTTETNSNNREFLGLRFQNVLIPQGATITSAHLEFTAEEADLSANPLVNITMELTDDAAPYTATEGDLWNGTNVNRVWNFSNILGGQFPTTSAEYENVTLRSNSDVNDPLNLQSQVQQIINRPGWCGGNALNFFIYPSYGINTTGNRKLKSFDSTPDPSEIEPPQIAAPRLVVEYDTSGITASDTGCIRRTLTYQPELSKDDATETLVDNKVTVLNQFRTGNTVTFTGGLATNTIAGIRFPNVDIPQNTTIISAYLQLTTARADSGATTLTVHGENTGNGLSFEPNPANLSDTTLRPRTIAAGLVDIPDDSVEAEHVFSTDISAIVSEIIAKTGWAPGNAINLFLSGGSSERRFHTFNTAIPYAPKLVIVTAGDSELDVRQRMIQLVDEQIYTLDRTPSVETLYEAGLYWRGGEVYYGRHRGQGGFPNSLDDPNDPDAVGTEQPDTGMNVARVSHPDSYVGGLVNRPADCPASNLDAPSCYAEVIDDHPDQGPPVYVSPFTIAECQNNFMIFLSDGAPTQNNEAPDLIASLVPDLDNSPGKCVENAMGNRGKCARDLVEFLNKEDQSDSINGQQTVTTYTIGFNIDEAQSPNANPWMKEVATAGGGSFFTANTSAELTEVFQSILVDIFDQVSSFAAPSLTVNAFNKLFHRNEVYFSLFQPSRTVRWEGNIKKYQICDGSNGCDLGSVLDANGDPAIGADGVISDNAVSIWSTGIDGPTIIEGGVGPLVPDHTIRNVYSYPYTSPPDPSNPVDLGLPDYELTTAPSQLALFDQLLGFPDGDTSAELQDLIGWIRGKDVDDDDNDGSITDNRWVVNDPLHGSPVAITYGCENGVSGSPCPDTDDNAIVKVLVAGNDGSIRMFNGHNDTSEDGGQEEWAFFPQQMLAQQSNLRTNLEGDHIYGVDSTPTIIQFDSNGDAIIDPAHGEYVRAYFTMRRGGNSIFALDVTPDADGGLTDFTSGGITPKYLWRIDGQSSLFPEFTNLAQTWSQPKPATVRVPKSGGGAGDSEYLDVLIFGGGYDESQDEGFGTSNFGNAIFIVDAATGERVWWASNEVVVDGNGDSPDLVLTDMDYPIPSDIALLDTNGDGATNRLYVGDMGGQVWRIDLDDQLGGGTSGPSASHDTTSGARLAVLSNLDADPANVEDHRKFFYAPDVIQTNDTIFAGQEYDLVTIVSGDRANPLEEDVLNRAYGLRDYLISEPLTEAGQYPLQHGADTDGDGNDDLFDTTDNLIQVGDSGQQEAAKGSLIASSGWFIDLTENGSKEGEKGLSSPIVLAGKLFFTTFLPGVTDPCQASEGTGRLYGIDAINASALFEDWLENGDDSALETGDRTYTLGGGIPSSAVPIFQKQGVTLLIGTGGGAESVDPNISLPRVRTYWYEE